MNMVTGERGAEKQVFGLLWILFLIRGGNKVGHDNKVTVDPFFGKAVAL